MQQIWFQYEEDAKNIYKLRMIAVKHKFPLEDYVSVLQRRFRIVPNTSDDRGGIFLVIDPTFPKTRRWWWQFWRRKLLNDGELFMARLSDHLQRINALGGSYSSFISQCFPDNVVSMLSTAAAEKMALTQSDLREHSFCFSQAPVSYWICTVSYSIAKAKQWFGETYGGYSKLLEHLWNSDHFRGSGCEVPVHVVCGQTKRDTWVNMTIFPVDSQRFGIKPILPIDLLTEAEKRF